VINNITDHIQAFLGYLPSGKAFNAKYHPSTNLRKLIEGMSSEFYAMDVALDEFKEEMLIDSTTDYISRWESQYGIPDHCFPIADTIEARRLNIIRKISMLGLQTASDFEGFATQLGLDIKVRSGIDHDSVNGYGTELPNIVFSSASIARFTVVVTNISSVSSFDYNFDFPFETPEQILMECVFRNLIPSNCQIVYTVVS
jgi:uncharacterized protein YmfQ (DUF2313 family)